MIIHFLSNENLIDLIISSTKAFKRKDHLTAHRRIHLNDFKHKCTWCGQGYHDVRMFKKHMLSVHGHESKINSDVYFEEPDHGSSDQ